MTSDAPPDTPVQVDAFVTPGTLLRNARLLTPLSVREVEDLLNLMPGYVGILERDDYQALRSPAFSRGYVRAYGQLMNPQAYMQMMGQGMNPETYSRMMDTLMKPDDYSDWYQEIITAMEQPKQSEGG